MLDLNSRDETAGAKSAEDLDVELERKVGQPLGVGEDRSGRAVAKAVGNLERKGWHMHS